MVAMVSLTSLLPGSALVMVPGAEDLPGRRGAGSSPNPESREPRDVREPAGLPGSLSEWAFALDGVEGRGLGRCQGIGRKDAASQKHHWRQATMKQPENGL